LRDTLKPTDLLHWYDQNARDLPWRIGPQARLAGVIPNPYHIWLSEIMLQQTTVVTVKAYYLKFKARWPKIGDLAAANDDDVMAAWAGLGYYARARNLLKCARTVVSEYGGEFPTSQQELLGLPGIGPYTAAAVGAIAFDQPAVVLDGNVERVISRIYRVQSPLPAAKETLRAHAATLTPKQRAGDYAQAIMDLGATVCTPRNPACGICPWRGGCLAQKMGDAQTFPRKTPKIAKPVRVGTAYVIIRNDGAVLLERRPDKGLLGGMLGWPGSQWATEPTAHEPPLDIVWQELPTEVRHTFTHFHLHLKVCVGSVSTDTQPPTGGFVAATDFRVNDLPTVMRKVWKLAAPSLTNA
jgi:A/G-specific adenine glycosylase